MLPFFKSLSAKQADPLFRSGEPIIGAILIGFSLTTVAEPLRLESVGLETVSPELLSFHDAQIIALRDTPTLRASQAQTDAARQAAIPAGTLPDPELALGIDNLPIEGPDRYSLTGDFMTMQRIGLMQKFPNQAKREARVQSASARVALMEAYERLTQQALLRETALAWIARQTLERQLTVLDDLLAENHLFAAAVRAQLAGGKAAAVDIIMPRQEAAMIAQRRDELTAKLAQSNAQLRRWVGIAANAPLTGEAPDWSLSLDRLNRRLHQHPELIAFQPKARALDAEIAEATAAKRPDWAVEFAYQKRGPNFGDMVMLQVSFDLPFFAGSRQEPLIAAKQAERVALEAEREAVLREHAAMLDSEFAEYQRLQQAELRSKEIFLTLADEKIALALAAWRGGKGSLTELIAARRERIDIQLNLIAITGERLQMAARLHYGYGDLSNEIAGLSQ